MSHWLRDASVIRRLACNWLGREEDGTKSGSSFCKVTGWLLQATGRAYKLLTGLMRCQSIGQRSVAILGNSVLQFCFSNITVCCYLVAIYAWNTVFWTKYFTEMDQWDTWEYEMTLYQ